MFQCVQLSDGSIVKLRLLDTAGQEKFNAITESYYKQADCCLLVYDITNKDSFDTVKNYIFMESSCADNYNVADAFTALVEMTNIELKKGNRINENIKIKKNTKKKKGCC